MPNTTFNYLLGCATVYSAVVVVAIVAGRADYDVHKSGGNNNNQQLIIGAAAQSAAPPFRLNLTNTLNLVCFVAYKDLQIGCTAAAGDGFNPLEIAKVHDGDEKGPEKLDKDWCTTYCTFLGCLKGRIPTAALDCPSEHLLQKMIVSTEEVFHERCSSREPDGSYSFVCNGSGMNGHLKSAVSLLVPFLTLAIFLLII